MLKLARERETLNVINDQFGAPTGADLLADVTAHSIKQVKSRPQDAGVYHLAAAGETTWFGYAKHVVNESIKGQEAPKIIVKEINAVASSAFPTAAKRPHNSRLYTAKLEQAFGLLAPWQLGVNRMLKESNLT